MRFGFVALMIAVAVSASAYADGDPRGLPNPFTDQQNRTGNITSVDKGVGDFASPIQNPDLQTSQPGNSGAATGTQTNTGGSSDSFYQSKKPGDGDR